MNANTREHQPSRPDGRRRGRLPTRPSGPVGILVANENNNGVRPGEAGARVRGHGPRRPDLLALPDPSEL